MAAPSDSPPVRVMLVEDDSALIEVLELSLLARGYDVVCTTRGAQALQMASSVEPDVVVLDLGLPDVDGLEVCRQLRRWFANPIIVLSADGAEDRKVAALDSGADDYVTKPFSLPELLARLRVATRHRSLVAAVSDPLVIEAGPLVIDTGARRVRVRGQIVTLTRTEFDLVVLLARHAGRVVTHREIAESLWGGGGDDVTKSLRVHLSNLRRKLGSDPDLPRISSESGVGYRLDFSEP